MQIRNFSLCEWRSKYFNYVILWSFNILQHEKYLSETATAHPRSRVAGHLKRCRMKTKPGRAETNLS